ncbi:MAG: ATP-binding cassette domain-containing protein [Bacteroidales bacterium]|nr:ATP-binding cassette domain-containing protein [Bacteroidales bacterium]MCF8343134.1 ATP-binding cassette domain-containing protein [Bacteroidales bacterium]MCF8351543.1 ATP-binding cassette domain-containing protein [Bacteroidales bacterium]MCF8376504.1 ATP-binding cassette domain-containing protein [Bacteroidales bacterium]
MRIQLIDVIPVPLSGMINSDSQIWNRNLLFDEARYYLITAPSGRGKTTLLSVIYGNRKDYEGRVLLGGEVVADMSAKHLTALWQSQFSFVFQDLRLFDELTALENIELKNKLTHHKSPGQMREMAQKLSVDPLLDRKAALLSRGEKQRVSIIRALCQPFNWLLLDEPFSHLDQDNIENGKELILEECQRQNAGIIFSSLKEDYGIDFHEKLRM